MADQSMKRLRIWGWYLLLAVTVSGIAIASISYHLGSSSRQDLLSVKQVVTYFAQAGLELKRDKSNPLISEEINGVKPVSFTIDKSEDQMLIYEYDDFKSRVDAARKWGEKGAEEGAIYSAKNILMIYVLGSDEPSIEDVNRVAKVKEVVFNKLNNAQKIVFTGEGQYWQARMTVDYYENWFRKKDGSLNSWDYDQYHFTNAELIYQGIDVSKLDEITYKFDSPSGGQGGTVKWCEDNLKHLGGSGGNGALPRKEQIYTVTVNWNGQLETFELKAAN
jgi:hypothetical protein